MNFDINFIPWQKRFGILSMFFLLGAMLSLVDALVGGLEGVHGNIELIPDSRYAISGPLPPKTDALKDFVIEGLPEDRSVSLVPEAIFSGYWFGGSMWRGVITVNSLARKGVYIISVKDRFGEKQNPTLVFTVRIWANKADRDANSSSFLTRRTGLNPFIFVTGLTILGILTGGVSFIFGRLWSRQLAKFQCGEIYKVNRKEGLLKIACEFHGSMAVQVGMVCDIYNPFGEKLCTAKVTHCGKREVHLQAKETDTVRHGDVVCLHAA